MFGRRDFRRAQECGVKPSPCIKQEKSLANFFLIQAIDDRGGKKSGAYTTLHEVAFKIRNLLRYPQSHMNTPPHMVIFAVIRLDASRVGPLEFGILDEADVVIG